MDKSKEILKFFPQNIKQVFSFLSEKQWDHINEIVFICGQPSIIQINGKREYVGKNGITSKYSDAFKASKNDMERIFELITESSVYAHKRFVNEGFLTLPGGNRVGIAGNCVIEKNEIISINNINSFCFRLSHDTNSNADLVIDEIYKSGKINNTIIISPPGCGKTTLLRGIASLFGKRIINKKIIKCAIIDERYEIAACNKGFATLDIGASSFVISGCLKQNAITFVVRSMSPDVIFTDEIATKCDIEAIKYARASGCSVITTTHGFDEENNELKFFDIDSLFDLKIVLSSKNGPGTIEKIIGGN